MNSSCSQNMEVGCLLGRTTCIGGVLGILEEGVESYMEWTHLVSRMEAYA
jgi:hypothetical protein